MCSINFILPFSIIGQVSFHKISYIYIILIIIYIYIYIGVPEKHTNGTRLPQESVCTEEEEVRVCHRFSEDVFVDVRGRRISSLRRLQRVTTLWSRSSFLPDLYFCYADLIWSDETFIELGKSNSFNLNSELINNSRSGNHALLILILQHLRSLVCSIIKWIVIDFAQFVIAIQIWPFHRIHRGGFHSEPEADPLPGWTGGRGQTFQSCCRSFPVRSSLDIIRPSWSSTGRWYDRM